MRSLTAAVTAARDRGDRAEIKRRSPSRGPLAPDLDPAVLATAYEAGGAAAISVLTEPEFFAGSTADLQAAAASVTIPVLRKDFVLHPAQVWESRAIGADAVLLIVAVLDDETLSHLIATAGEAGIETLVEIHDEAEATRALAAGARVIGVNARKLATFEVDLKVAERLAESAGRVRGPGRGERDQRAGRRGKDDGGRLRRCAGRRDAGAPCRPGGSGGPAHRPARGRR